MACHLICQEWSFFGYACLNLDGTLGISSLVSGDNGDVRTNRVGRVEVGRQLWYFGIRLVMMIHRIANKMVEVGRQL